MSSHVPLRSFRLAAGAIAVSIGCADVTVPIAPLPIDQPNLAPGGGKGGGGGGGSVVESIVGLEPLIGATVNFSSALKVSDFGQIVGTSATSTGAGRAVIWDGSTFAQDLGTFDGGESSEASAILPNGTVIVGSSNLRAVRWVNLSGVWTIDALPDPVGGNVCAAVDIASDGTIVGNCRFGGFSHVTWWRNGIATDLGPGAARAVNRNGQILVQVSLESFIWDTRTNPVTVTPLGSLGGSGTAASDINDFGDVVGSSRNAAFDVRPFLWTAKKGMVDLGTLVGGVDGQADAINNAGQIVGTTFSGGTPGRATYWFKGKVIDLGVLPGYERSHARGINAAGQVVGHSTLSVNGNTTDVRATLWSLK